MAAILPRPQCVNPSWQDGGNPVGDNFMSVFVKVDFELKFLLNIILYGIIGYKLALVYIMALHLLGTQPLFKLTHDDRISYAYMRHEVKQFDTKPLKFGSQNFGYQIRFCTRLLRSTAIRELHTTISETITTVWKLELGHLRTSHWLTRVGQIRVAPP